MLLTFFDKIYFQISLYSKMMPNFWQLVFTPILINLVISFDYSWFLAKNLSNFVSPSWKLNNPYYHNVYLAQTKMTESEMFTLSTCNEMPWPLRPKTDKKKYLFILKTSSHRLIPEKQPELESIASAGVMKKRKGSISCEKNDIPWTADNTQLYKWHSVTTWTIFYPLLTI